MLITVVSKMHTQHKIGCLESCIHCTVGSIRYLSLPDGKEKLDASEITFRKVNKHHAGTYVCTANNGLFGQEVNLITLTGLLEIES